jgi:hypothetical protein
VLTLEKLAVYRRFDGDIDAWARTSGPAGPSGMTDADWFLIDELRQALAMVASGLAAPEFRAAVERRLTASAADEQTRQALRELGALSPGSAPTGR